MWKPYRVEDSVEAISHIAWIGKVAVLVRYQGLVLTEIHFFTQFLYHLYRRVIKRYVTLARFAFQLADFKTVEQWSETTSFTCTDKLFCT